MALPPIVALAKKQDRSIESDLPHILAIYCVAREKNEAAKALKPDPVPVPVVSDLELATLLGQMLTGSSRGQMR